jgi:hypothetical protein
VEGEKGKGFSVVWVSLTRPASLGTLPSFLDGLIGSILTIVNSSKAKWHLTRLPHLIFTSRGHFLFNVYI